MNRDFISGNVEYLHCLKTEFYILDEAVCVSLSTNGFGKGMNPSLLYLWLQINNKINIAIIKIQFHTSHER